MPDEDFGFSYANAHISVVLTFICHTHICLPAKSWSVLISVYLIVHVQLTFLKNVIPTLPFLFSKAAMFFFDRNEVIYFCWYEGRNESLKF